MNKEIIPAERIVINDQNDCNDPLAQDNQKSEKAKEENDKDKFRNDELTFKAKKGEIEIGAKNITEKTIILTVVILLFLTIWIAMLKF